jgi:hypothetical protein
MTVLDKTSRCVYDRTQLHSTGGSCRPQAYVYPNAVQGSVARHVFDAALTFNVPYRVLHNLARCESSLNPRASDGFHFGLYQFLPSTFSRVADQMRRETGITVRSYWDSLDASYVAAFDVVSRAADFGCST